MSTPTMAIRHLDILSHIPAERLHASPNIAVISIGRPQHRPMPLHQDFGLACSLQLDAGPDENADEELSTANAIEIVQFLERAALHPNINMLVVHSENTQSLPAAVAWFASAVYQAKFVTQRRIDIPDGRALATLEQAAHVQVGRPGAIVVKTGYVANQAEASH